MPDIISFPPFNPVLAALADQSLIYEVTEDDAGERLDRYVAAKTGLSRGQVRQLIEFGSVWVGGKVCKRQSRPVEAGFKVIFYAPAYGPTRFYEADPDRIIYRDEWLLAYNKEAGIPSQQTPYDAYNHLYGGLQRQLGDGAYLALHHRLDAATSGVMIFALKKKVNLRLGRMFQESRIRKEYLAVISGVPAQEQWTMDRPIAKRKGGYFCPENGPGKPAQTEFRVIAKGGANTLVLARPLTGRTHQIRLHALAAGHPILGDNLYRGPQAKRLMLHAVRLSFDHPVTKQPVTIEAPKPEGFDEGAF